MHLKLFPMSSSKEKPVRRIRCPVKRHIRSDCTPPSLSAPHCAAHLTSPLQQSHFFLTHWFDPFCDRIRLSVRLVCAPKRTVGNCSSERLWLLQTHIEFCAGPAAHVQRCTGLPSRRLLQWFVPRPVAMASVHTNELQVLTQQCWIKPLNTKIEVTSPLDPHHCALPRHGPAAPRRFAPGPSPF